MNVTDAAWSEQVARADNAEMREASAYVGIAQVLREHGGCICRHSKRILGNVLLAREKHPLWKELGEAIPSTTRASSPAGDANNSASPPPSPAESRRTDKQ